MLWNIWPTWTQPTFAFKTQFKRVGRSSKQRLLRRVAWTWLVFFVFPRYTSDDCLPTFRVEAAHPWTQYMEGWGWGGSGLYHVISPTWTRDGEWITSLPVSVKMALRVSGTPLPLPEIAPRICVMNPSRPSSPSEWGEVYFSSLP